ncbi:ExeM/NucH family extracellular endonuclease [Actinoplanes sp. NPDC051851]|uniref:ExeM/NucH family extracellular endonuclease n=1 Tax=Actinoplanes sp. NPDC051851 TaxID=3154753 RepID=UPI003412E775
MRPYSRSVSSAARANQLRAIGAAALATVIGLSFTASAYAATDTPFISEIHYDNVGTDSGEAIEIEAPVGFDLSGWQIVLYNGDSSSGATYGTTTLSGQVPDAGVVVQTYASNGIQNGSTTQTGSPDGVALVKPDGTVAEFLSYEGTFTATNGPAVGLTSTDIGVAETSATPVGYSLQKVDGVWKGEATSTFGTLNSATTTPTEPEEPTTGCTTTVTNTIAEVQGTGTASTLTGSTVTVEGIVTADHTTGGFNGFYVQTAGSGGDSHAVAEGVASDAIFVYGSAANLPTVAIGDQVRVTGVVSEYNGLTELTVGAKTATEICATGQTVPTATPLALPATDAARESVEGMLVAPTGTYTVSDPYYLTTYGEVVLNAGSSVAKVPTDLYKAGSTEALALKAANRASRILLDDARTTNLSGTDPQTAPPYITKDAPIRAGDTVKSFGSLVLDYSYGDWLLEPTTPISADTNEANRTSFTASNPRTSAPAEVGGDIKVASFNVLNYFVHFGGDARGADDAAGLAKQQAKIVAAITALDADVISLMEIENSVKFDTANPQLALQTLVGALNEVDGAGTWDYVRSPAELPSAAEQDVITSAIIYKPAKATPVGASRSINDETVWSNAREPIAQTFHAGSIDFTVVANHLKSKSTSVTPTGDNVDAGDGQGAYTGDRKRQAQSLVDFVEDVKADSGTDNVILLGDFNSYTQEDPMQVLYGAGYTDVHTTKTNGKSSYVYGGESGSLDHALTSESLTDRVTGVDIWNINSVESYAYEYDGYAPFYSADPYRASDHDPVVVGLDTDPIDLQLLSINDFHGRLEQPATNTGGAAWLVGLVDKLRAANPYTLWSSDGDNVGASTFISSIDSDNPTIDALNAGGLDVSAVGNHEFDKGIDDLTGHLEERADFDYLGANVYKDGVRALQPYAIKEVAGIRVGYVGVVTQETSAMVSPAGIVGVEFRDPVAEANALATQLTDGDESNGEADVLVLLAHEGAATENITSAEALQADPVFGPFTRVSAEYEAILSGHTHQPYAFEIPVPGSTTGKTRPVLQAEDYGLKLGRAVLTIDPATKEVTASTAELIDVNTTTSTAPDATVAAIVTAAKANSAVLGAEQLGTITTDIKRAYSATGTEDRGSESVMGNFIADVQLDQTSDAGRGGAQIALMNPGGLRADLLTGDDGVVTYSEAYAVQPFANDVVTQTLTGAQLKEVLEQQWQPATASRPILHLGSSKGFTYAYDESQAAGSRIIASSMKLNGVTIDPAGSYRVTSNSFLAAGGDNFTTLALGTNRVTTGDNDLTMLVNYFAKYTPITADTGDRAVPGVLDITAPTGSYTVDTTAETGAAVTLTQSALSDDVSDASAISQVVNWGDGSAAETLAAGSTSVTHAYTVAGTYTVQVTVTDEAGNAVTVGAGSVVVSDPVTPTNPDTTSPTAAYKVNATTLWPGQSVTLTETALSDDVSAADKLTRVISWGDGSTETLAAGKTTATHKFATAGSYSIKVTVTDEAGNAADVIAATVAVKAQTGAYTLSTKSIWTGQSVTLKVGSVTNATSVKISWGDGATTTASPNIAVSHKYTKAGTFKVTVTPVNALGSGTAVTVGSVKVTKDTYKPSISLKAPHYPAKVSSWKTITGKVSDKGLGVDSVKVKLVEQRSGKWYYYSHGKWTKASSKSKALAKAETLTAKVSGGSWSVKVSGLKKGTLRVGYWAKDKAGNSSATKVYTQKLTK